MPNYEPHLADSILNYSKKRNMNIKGYIKETLKYLLRSHLFVNRYVREIDAMYDMSPEELKERNEKRFLEIFRKAFSCSSYYRSLCQEHGVTTADDVRCLEDIVKLPVLTKDMLKKHGKELLTRKEKRLIKNHTSGTTGTPLTVYQDWASVWREQAYFVCYRKRCGYNYGEPIVSLRGNLTRKEVSLKVHVSNTLYLSSYNINAQTAETYHRLIEKHHPKAIEGYPSSLYSLALVFRDKGLECHIPVAFTSSETMFDYQRKLIEQVFHTQIYDHYGTTERTNAAMVLRPLLSSSPSTCCSASLSEAIGVTVFIISWVSTRISLCQDSLSVCSMAELISLKALIFTFLPRIWADDEEMEMFFLKLSL